MANMASKVRFPVDLETFLQDENTAAVTNVGDNPSDKFLSLDELSSYWDQGEIAMPQQIAVVFNLTALDFADTDETYELRIEADSVNDFSDAPAFVASLDATAVGMHVIMLPRELFRDQYPNAAFIRANLLLGGTTPSATYYAWVSPVIGH